MVSKTLITHKGHTTMSAPTTINAEPQIVLYQAFTRAGYPSDECEAQQALARFQKALAPNLTVELRYEGQGRRRSAIITATNGPARRGRYRLTAAELERAVCSALCAALGQG